MAAKYCKTRSDDLSYWNVKRCGNNNEVENVDNEERSIAFSVSLLLKNKSISRSSRIQLPSHLVSSPNCQCHRSFHLFCTDLLQENDKDIDMINIHPAPRNRDRDARRSILISTSDRKHRHRNQEDNDQDTIVTTGSEPCHKTISESQLLERKLRVPPKFPTQTSSLNIPSVARLSFSKYNNHRFPLSFPIPLNYSPSIRASKQATSFAQLQIRALSVFDQSPSSSSQMYFPRGPPPSPKTPTQESSTILPYSITPAAFRAISILPRPKNSNDNEKKVTNTHSVKNASYENHAREYLSASDCSDDESDENDKVIQKLLTMKKLKLSLRTESLSRPGTGLRDRFFSNTTNRYLNLADIYYSPLDMYKNISYQSRRRLRAQTRLMFPKNENDDALTTITKKTTKTTPIPPPPPPPQSKSVFGFSKTASSMHFGHAVGRLGLQGSFEKWPQPISRRTPMERKQEVTTLRLVTLPLVTS